MESKYSNIFLPLRHMGHRKLLNIELGRISAEEYQSKISGPLLDRIDLQIDVPLLPPWTLGQMGPSENSKTVLNRVMQARQFQLKRGQKHLNAHLDGTVLEETAHLTPVARQNLIHAAEQMRLSGRGFHRMIRLGRTIADMSFSDEIQPEHIQEALAFRLPERKK